LAERDLTRYEKLRGTQTASEKAFDDAQVAVAQREAALAERRQTIETLEARLDQQDAAISRLEVAIERAERDLANTELRAPFAGFVAGVEAALGKWVNAGDPIARLIDESSLEVRFTLADADFGRLWRDGLIGRPLQASWRLGGTTFPLQGEVTRVESTIDPASGGVEVFAAITANPEAAPLRPGSTERSPCCRQPRCSTATPSMPSRTAGWRRARSSWSPTAACRSWCRATFWPGSRC
jgi:multidrug efflux pump subunit AcrA (membrane-fusion protein)